MPTLSAVGATLDHPLLQQLHEVDQYVRKNVTLPPYAGSGLGSVGLILTSTLEHGGYWCSPRNALTFATTGGGGDHYSLLIQGGAIKESSPVVLTWPSEGDQIIVGESLYDFLCCGMHGGYFQFLHGSDDALTVEAHGLQFLSHVEAHQQQVIAIMADKLNLKPWPVADRSARFRSLAERFLSLIESAEDAE